jgi:glycerol-3-phosphate dehydrogenase
MRPRLTTAPPPKRIDRAALLAEVRQHKRWDVIVIGGGATGLGTALDAVSRGYRTLLVEAHDFAKGTSGKSTKLIHGGVRYLAQGNISLVRESLRERELLLRNASHLVWPLGFVVPSYGYFDTAFYGTGLKLYDAMAGRDSLPSSRILSASETRAASPGIAPAGPQGALRGGVLYYDCQFDDARLAIAMMRSIIDLGGTALNSVAVRGLTLRNGLVCGVELEDTESGERLQAIADCVINATGVWVDGIRRMEDPAAPSMVSPSQGIHLVLPRRFLPGAHAVLIPRTTDGRILFMLPWGGHTLLGTTDTARDDHPLEPQPSDTEIDFILSTAARYLSVPPTRADITSTWAGLRPLVRASSDMPTRSVSREHAITLSRGGLLTITGGKWTTYRRMAEDAINQAIRHGLLPSRPCRTEQLRLHGAPEGAGNVYGTDAPHLLTLPGADESLTVGGGLTAAHVRFAARYEQARSVEDVLARRCRLLLLDAQAACLAAPAVARLLAEELGHGPEWIEQQLRTFTEGAQIYGGTTENTE